MTNGVTPRRWVHCANPALSGIFTKYLGSQKWLTDLTLLKEMLQHKEDPKLHAEWMAMKRGCKAKLAEWLQETMDLQIDQEALIDIQIKRIHEYKRQLLNILFVIHHYLELKRASPGDREQCQKRVVLIGGKAASAYVNAKIIIKLINNVAKVINADPETSAYLKCAFVPNYCVSAAEVLIPASDVSEHISTAGTEASGTSNMKFVMNGGLIVGTMDGANIEIREECGEDTMFIFGCLEHEVPSVIQAAQRGHYPIDGRLQEVFEAIRGGRFSEGEPDAQAEFNSILDRLCNLQAAGTWDGDRYLVIHDFPSFVDAQAKVDATYKDKATWCRLSIQAASSMSKFSTDRTIAEYADVIWGLKPARRELEPIVVGSVPVPKPKAECMLKVDAIPKAARPVKDTLRPGTLSADAKAEPKQGKVNVQASDAAADGSAS